MEQVMVKQESLMTKINHLETGLTKINHLETAALTKIDHQQNSFYREMDALNKDMEQVMVKQESLMEALQAESKEGSIADPVKEGKEVEYYNSIQAESKEGSIADPVKEEKEVEYYKDYKEYEDNYEPHGARRSRKSARFSPRSP